MVLRSLILVPLHICRGPIGVLQTGFVGLLLGVLYLVVKRNLWIGILVHGLIDTLSLAAVVLGAAS